MTIDAQALDQIFLKARTANGFTDEPVPEALLRQVYDVARMGPTSMNCQPTRRGIRFTARAESGHGDRAFRITIDAGHKPGDVRFRTNQRR